MKSEAWIFGICTTFFVLVSLAYWFITYDWTGTSALVMTALMATMVFGYLFFHANRLDPRPEDRSDAEIADGAGELGFFPPYSWWPLWLGLSAAVIFLGLAVGWWIVIIGMGIGIVSICGWTFEHFKGEYAN